MSDDFWDKRARVLRYHADIHRIKMEGGTVPSTCRTVADLEAVAGQSHESVSFAGELARFNVIGAGFVPLSPKLVSAAISVGVLGAVVAYATDWRGKQKLEAILKDFDKGSPCDALKGADHRSYFGHDLLNPMQQLPPGFRWGSEDVGGQTLWELAHQKYGGGGRGWLAGNLLTLLHLAVHYGKDFVTPAGLPIPGSSLFTTWSNNTINTCGFSRKNPLMDTLGREFGSLSLSDMTSSIFVLTLSRGLANSPLFRGQVDASDVGVAVLQKQIEVLGLGTCLLIQLGLLAASILHDPRLQEKWYAAKANLVMLGMLGKASLELHMHLTNRHHAVLAHYQRSIDRLRDEESTFDEWVRGL